MFCVAAIPAHAAVVVSFAHADRYTDAGRFTLDSRHVLAELEQHLKRLGERLLPPYETLSIEVLDVDLAGDDRAIQRNGADVRVLKGTADWPSITLRYTLEAQGKTLQRREETVSDMNYLMRTDNRYSQEALPYEKRMLDTWFKARFVRQESAR